MVIAIHNWYNQTAREKGEPTRVSMNRLLSLKQVHTMQQILFKTIFGADEFSKFGPYF